MESRKSRIALLMLFPCCLSSAHILWAQADGSSITCGNYRTVHSDVLGEDRTLLIRLPEDYGKSDKKYPVLYKLDGELGNFLHALSAANYLVDWKGAPDPIIVGIANTDRGRDMAPARAGRQLHSVPKRRVDSIHRQELPNQRIPDCVRPVVQLHVRGVFVFEAAHSVRRLCLEQLRIVQRESRSAI